MEWKRAKGGVSVQTCDDSLTDRISISGDYDSHECGLTITSLQLEDAGNWECEVRNRFSENVFRDFLLKTMDAGGRDELLVKFSFLVLNSTLNCSLLHRK